MTDTLKDYLKLVEPFIPPQLISSKAFSNIGAIAQILPPVLESGFECRLGVDAPTADFALCVTASDNNHKTFAGLSPIIDLPEAFLTDPAWNYIRNFCVHWANKTSLIYEDIDSIWLEFDMDESEPKIPTPSIFISLQNKILSNLDTLIADVTVPNYTLIIETAFSVLFGRYISSEIKQNLAFCVDLLPSNIKILQVGIMIARKSDALRLCVGSFHNKTQLIEYLKKIGWSGCLNNLKYIVSNLYNFTDEILLDFDIQNTVLPKIGIECYINNQSKNNPNWINFLSFLVENGLCTSQKRDGLLNWPGYIRKQDNQEIWPKNLRKVSSFISSNYSCIVLRKVNHIKVVYQDEKIIEAKAYLLVKYHWINLSLNNKNFVDKSQ